MFLNLGLENAVPRAVPVLKSESSLQVGIDEGPGHTVPKIICIPPHKTKPVLAGADATVYVWVLGQI